MQANVFGAHAGLQFANQTDAHGFGSQLPQGLCGQYVRDLRSPDAKTHGPQCAVRGGVAVATNHHHAGVGQTLLGSNHVNDALPGVVESDLRDAMALGVGAERVNHAHGTDVHRPGAIAHRGHVVIGHPYRQCRLCNRQATLGYLAERVKRAFMHVMTVHPKQALP